MRLIDADAIEYCETNVCCGHGDYRMFRQVTDNMIDEMQTVDAVPVVRCKDCVNYCGFEHCKNGICDLDSVSKRAVYPNDFCSYGERKTDG